ncbi:MAG: hypothetical protein WCJ30_26725 [Deltaproteobacteria bacterium]
MHLVLLPAVLRLVAVSALAAVAVLLHVRLAWRARTEGTGRAVAAWLVPGAGAVLAWHAGARVGPVSYALAIVAYVTLLTLG